MRTMFDLNKPSDSGTCGIISTSSAPLMYCGYGSFRGTGTGAPSGGLIYLKSLDSRGLHRLGDVVGLKLALTDETRSGGTRQPDVDSLVGKLPVTTAFTGNDRMAVDVTLPTVNHQPVVLESSQTRPRPPAPPA